MGHKPATIDWGRLRGLYAADHTLTLEDIAGIARCSHDTVRRHARKENWKGLRRQARDAATVETAVATLDTLADEMRAFEVKRIKATMSLTAETYERASGGADDRAVQSFVTVSRHYDEIKPTVTEEAARQSDLVLIRPRLVQSASESSSKTSTPKDSNGNSNGSGSRASDPSPSYPPRRTS